MSENKLFSSTHRCPHIFRCFSTQADNLPRLWAFSWTTGPTASNHGEHQVNARKRWRVPHTRYYWALCGVFGLFTIEEVGVITKLIVHLRVGVLEGCSLNGRSALKSRGLAYLECDVTLAPWLQAPLSINAHHPRPVTTNRVVTDGPTLIILPNRLANLDFKLCLKAFDWERSLATRANEPVGLDNRMLTGHLGCWLEKESTTYFTVMKRGKVQLPFTFSALDWEGRRIFETFLIWDQGIKRYECFHIRVTRRRALESGWVKAWKGIG